MPSFLYANARAYEYTVCTCMYIVYIHTYKRERLLCCGVCRGGMRYDCVGKVGGGGTRQGTVWEGG